MKYNVVLFDLDGTLTDPGVGITNAVSYALNKFNIEVKDKKDLYPFIGPPLITSFMKFYGMDEDRALEAVEEYRVYYKDKGLFENKVYDGIEKLLKELKSNNIKLIVATSKPEVFAIQIIEKFGLSNYFDMVCGTRLDRHKDTKADVIRYALEENNIKNLEKVIMVGDREHDTIGAKTIGIDSLGVLYGYGTREELKIAGANHIVEKVEDIKDIILGS